MPELIPINPGTDVIIDTTKVTAGFFTGNLGTLAVDNLTTASLSTSQKGYYYNMQYSSEDQLSVAFGHYAGSGSAAAKETKAIYMQFKNLLVSPDDISSTSSNGFVFKGNSPTSGSAVAADGINAQTSDGGLYEDGMYFIVMDRARMKDRLNKKNWTLTLSGSKGVPGGIDHATSGSSIKLTDDSATVTGESTIAGVRYNVVSGSDGSLHDSSSFHYGYIYPNIGIIALRASFLSSSIFGLPGNDGPIPSASFMDLSGTNGNGTGFAFSTGSNNGNWSTSEAVKLAQAIHMGEQKFRSEEDQTSKSYFCRAFANDFNYSNNPTFTSGSDAIIANTDMIGYPHTFITSIGLYQTGKSGPELVAVGKLSGPVQKNYGTEATIKVKLTY